MRREFGLTDEELLDKWDFWQSLGYMEAAAELLTEMNRSESAPAPETKAGITADARKHLDVEQLKMMGFNVAGEGG